jgi:hypothetical protein
MKIFLPLKIFNSSPAPLLTTVHSVLCQLTSNIKYVVNDFTSVFVVMLFGYERNVGSRWPFDCFVSWPTCSPVVANSTSGPCL